MALDLRIIIGDEDLDIVKTFDKENIYDIRGKKIILNDRYEELNELFESGI